MSGSPVYIDGRLVGAIAFSFPFSKEPIAGITPIKQMIDIFESATEGGTSRPQQARPVSFTQLASTDLKLNLPKPVRDRRAAHRALAPNSPLVSLMGQQLSPIATPVVFGGISRESLALFAPQLESNGLLPVSGAGGAAAITPLAPATEKTLDAGNFRQRPTRARRLFDRRLRHSDVS